MIQKYVKFVVKEKIKMNFLTVKNKSMGMEVIVKNVFKKKEKQII